MYHVAKFETFLNLKNTWYASVTTYPLMGSGMYATWCKGKETPSSSRSFQLSQNKQQYRHNGYSVRFVWLKKVIFVYLFRLISKCKSKTDKSIHAAMYQTTGVINDALLKTFNQGNFTLKLYCVYVYWVTQKLEETFILSLLWMWR
jgi:hypothetical protein